MGCLLLISPIASIVYALTIRKEYLRLLDNKIEIENREQARIYENTQTTPNTMNFQNTRTNRNSQININQQRNTQQENTRQTNTNVFDFEGKPEDKDIVPNYKININTSSYEEIKKLPGINIILIKKLENTRNNGIKIKNMSQLAEIWDLSPHHIKQLEPYITFDLLDDNTERQIDL